MLDYIRIACAVPEVQVANVEKNVQDICAFMEKADAQKTDVLLFPELALTGYSCGDLFLQDTLLNASEKGLMKVLECSAQYPALTVVVGLPVRSGMKLYNCAAVICDGNVRQLVSKTYLPDYGESNESRWFSAAAEGTAVTLAGQTLFIDSETLYPVADTLIGIEICEDLFAPIAPSAFHALSGAEVILNLAASPEMAGKHQSRKDRVIAQSAACKCIYAFASAGYTESTADLVFSGHSIIAENGVLLQENAALTDTGYLLVQDCDLGRIRAERRRNTTFRAAAERYGTDISDLTPVVDTMRADGALYPLQKLPFIPSTAAERKA